MSGCARLVAGAWLSVMLAASAAAQMRVVNWNVAGLDGNVSALQDVLAALNVDDKPGFATAPWVYVFQEVQDNATPDWAVLLTRLNAAAPPGITYALATYTNFGENSAAGAQACYYRTDKIAEDVSGHVDIYTQASRYADRWLLRLVGYDDPPVYFYIYSAHLKASNTSSDRTLRNLGAAAIRANADALPPGEHIIFAGDFNLYSHTEPAYLTFLSPGPAQAIDPLGTGTWAGAANALKHTQSPYGGSGGLVGGGMDDRFDFQLSTVAFHDGAGLSIIPGSYRTFGNDGNHYDVPINAGTNTYYLPNADALAALLAVASDHLPVVVEYQVPAILAASLSPADFGRVVQGAALEAVVLVSNVADAVVPAGVDALDFVATGAGVLSGVASGTVAGLAPPVAVSLPVETDTIGLATGTVVLQTDRQGAQGSGLLLGTSRTVVRPASPSLSPGEPQHAATVSLDVPTESGVAMLTAPVWNLDHDADQAFLDVDAVSPPAAPFAFVGGLVGGVGATPAVLTFAFDTAGLVPGTYEAPATVTVSDEDLPGERVAALELLLRVNVQRRFGDLNLDGFVDTADIEQFASCMTGPPPGTPPVESCQASDVQEDGAVDLADFAVLQVHFFDS